jgi:hypothetical protein
MPETITPPTSMGAAGNTLGSSCVSLPQTQMARSPKIRNRPSVQMADDSSALPMKRRMMKRSISMPSAAPNRSTSGTTAHIGRPRRTRVYAVKADSMAASPCAKLRMPVALNTITMPRAISP